MLKEIVNTFCLCRKNSLRPAHLPGPSALCKLPEVKVFRRGDEPFRAQGSDLYFPLTTPQAFNTCAIVSSAGSILKSHLGREIGKDLSTQLVFVNRLNETDIWTNMERDELNDAPVLLQQ